MASESLLLSPNTRVTCPKCEHEFALAEGFAKQALESVEKSSDSALAELRENERQAAERRSAVVARERDEAHAASLAQVRKLAEENFKPQLQELRTQLTERDAKLARLDQREAALREREKTVDARVAELAAEKAAELVAAERQSYEKRLSESQAQVKALRAEQLSLREERQQLKDQKEALALDVRRQVDERSAERELKVRTQEQQKASLEKAEIQKKLDDVTDQLTEAQRKIAQGSQQLQGEVLELAIEEALARAFPHDSIEEVKKGVRGGDVIQRVMTRSGQSAGSILWESKRAKDFSPGWIVKLKDNMRGCGADVGVIVTMPTAVPKEWATGQSFGLHEDVWVAAWSVAIAFGDVLRSGLLDVHKQRLVSAGKGEKMEAVYDYVTSPQFAQKLRAVMDVFKRMRDELESEKNVTMQRWARRDKQLEGGIAALLGVGGEIQGLAQVALQALELDGTSQAEET